MRFAPGVVVVVVDGVGDGAANDSANALDHPLAPGIGVRAGKSHSGDVLSAELAGLVEERRLDVDAILASSEADELGRGLVAEATRAEMHADPDPAVLIREQVDVVVPGTDRTKLVARHALELADLRNFMPERAIEELVLDLLHVRAPDPERHVLRDVGDDWPDLVGDRRALHIEAHRHVAAADVEADAADRDVFLVGDDAADRLGIAEMAIGAKHAAGDAADRHASGHLLLRLVVVGSKHLERDHGALLWLIWSACGVPPTVLRVPGAGLFCTSFTVLTLELPTGVEPACLSVRSGALIL